MKRFENFLMAVAIGLAAIVGSVPAAAYDGSTYSGNPENSSTLSPERIAAYHYRFSESSVNQFPAPPRMGINRTRWTRSDDRVAVSIGLNIGPFGVSSRTQFQFTELREVSLVILGTFLGETLTRVEDGREVLNVYWVDAQGNPVRRLGSGEMVHEINLNEVPELKHDYLQSDSETPYYVEIPQHDPLTSEVTEYKNVALFKDAEGHLVNKQAQIVGVRPSSIVFCEYRTTLGWDKGLEGKITSENQVGFLPSKLINVGVSRENMTGYYYGVNDMVSLTSKLIPAINGKSRMTYIQECNALYDRDETAFWYGSHNVRSAGRKIGLKTLAREQLAIAVATSKTMTLAEGGREQLCAITEDRPAYGDPACMRWSQGMGWGNISSHTVPRCVHREGMPENMGFCDLRNVSERLECVNASTNQGWAYPCDEVGGFRCVKGHCVRE